MVAERGRPAYIRARMNGMVYLVGAGPGDPGLLTLRGAELLRQAEVVIYDGLVNPDLLRHAPASAERIYGGKHDRTRAIQQTDINRLLIEKAAAGKRVVRLKGGDPFVFARGGEEAQALAKAKIPFEVVPGVSSVEAVPGYAGIPLTHRDFSSSYTVVTGHECPGRPEHRVDWSRFANVPGTLVVLMGLAQLRRITGELIAHGRAPETPVAVIHWGTTGRQKTWTGTLATMAEIAEKEAIQPPAITVIGEVVQLRSQLSWFEKRPLIGQRVVVTRARSQAAALSAPLLELGAEVLEIPAIRFGPPSEKVAIAETLASLNTFDWIVFTSVTAVTAFFDFFFQGFQDMRDLGGSRIAAVGAATAAQLKALRLQVDVMPTQFSASHVAEAMSKFESLENRKILLPRAETAISELPRLLEDLGAIVDDIPFYQTLPETETLHGADLRLQAAGADWLTFASGSAIEHFNQRFNLKELTAKHPGLKIASIGPETTKILVSLGLKAAAEAKPATMEGLVASLVKAARKEAKEPKSAR
jgi:uroporphyrinogen III methyltransferase / synthase